MPDSTHAIGVDIGGSGIKAAVVDVVAGKLAGERIRVATPQPATPDAVIAATAGLVEQLDAPRLPVGVGVPAVVLSGTVRFVANLDAAWLGVNVEEALRAQVGRPCEVLNDADAAGLAEVRFGAGIGHSGVVLMLTLGTGIGSALFIDGVLVPNTEFGHIEVRGKDGERRASAGARERHGWSYEKWAVRREEYLRRIDVRPRGVAATLQNLAGIVGAAVRAAGVEPIAR